MSSSSPHKKRRTIKRNNFIRGAKSKNFRNKKGTRNLFILDKKAREAGFLSIEIKQRDLCLNPIEPLPAKRENIWPCPEFGKHSECGDNQFSVHVFLEEKGTTRGKNLKLDLIAEHLFFLRWDCTWVLNFNCCLSTFQIEILKRVHFWGFLQSEILLG